MAFSFVPQCLILGQIVGWNVSLTRLNTPSSKPKYTKERTCSMDRDKHMPAPKTLPSIGGILSFNESAIPNMFKGGGGVFSIILLKGEESLLTLLSLDSAARLICLGGTDAVVVVNVDIVDLLVPRVEAKGEEKAARLGRSTRQARFCCHAPCGLLQHSPILPGTCDGEGSHTPPPDT